MFWLDNLEELYKNDNYLQFIPNDKQTKEQQLNAITRLCMYCILLVLIFEKDIKYVYILTVVIIFIVMLQRVDKNDPMGKVLEFNDRNKKLLTNNSSDLDNSNNLGNNVEHFGKRKHRRKHKANKVNKRLETGNYDSNGQVNPDTIPQVPTSHEQDMPVHSFDEYNKYIEGTCKKPDINNPYMNPLVDEHNDGDIPAACNADNEEISDKITATFNENLYRNIEDVFERSNYQRQFYTVPNTTIPNQQTEFSNWLYNTDTTCKENSFKCLRYEDLRFKR